MIRFTFGVKSVTVPVPPYMSLGTSMLLVTPRLSLAGGNLFAHLLPDGPRLSPEEIAGVLGDSDAHFWMGRVNLSDGEGVLTGGENEAGVCQFGIFVLSKEDAPQA